MLRYVLNRLLQAAIILFIISIVIYFIVDLMPGDPLASWINPEEIQHIPDLDLMKEQLGLTGPVWYRYIRWLGNLLQGNFGFSLAFRQDVVNIIPSFLRNTLILNISALIIGLTLSIIVGIKTAVKRFSLFDNFFTVFSLIGISMPSFVLAMLLILAFVIVIPIFPFSGLQDARIQYHGWSLARMLDMAYHLTLPIIVICMGQMAVMVRFVRNSMLDVLKQDYIRTARSKGLKDKVIIYRHAFKNALIPIITLVGFSIPGVFMGGIIIENIFMIPGMGRLLVFHAYTARDAQLVTVILMLFAVLTVFSTIIVDLSYGLVDPRMKVGGGSK